MSRDLRTILVEHLGCYHNDYDECGAHSTLSQRRPWPCEVLTSLESELETWVDEQALSGRKSEAISKQIDGLATCETDPEHCDLAEENCCDGCASGLGPCYGPGLHVVCHNEEHRKNNPPSSE